MSLQSGADGNVIQGNYIGLDITGTVALANDKGIEINGGTGNTIGGTAAGAANVVSSNQGFGIDLGNPGTTGNMIVGNLIGTDPSGTTARGNSVGVRIIGSSGNTVGGTNANAGNTISANVQGIRIEGSSNNNVIQGNRVGTTASGSGALGNDQWGVWIFAGSNNAVGGVASGAGNVIAYNGDDGVYITNDNGNSVLGNSIFDNEGSPGSDLGIDLDADGVTAERPGRRRHRRQRPAELPVLTSSNTNAGSTSVAGTLSSQPNTDYRLEFFANDECDPSGFGEGQTFLAARSVTTDASGDASFSFTFANPGGSIITSTATDPLNNTSEFSECADNADAATLIVIKHVINDNGGTAVADDFTLDSGGTDDTPDDFPGAEAPGTSVSMSPGSYNVTETGPSGYTASFSADCAGSIASRRDQDLHGHQQRHPGRQPDHAPHSDLRSVQGGDFSDSFAAELLREERQDLSGHAERVLLLGEGDGRRRVEHLHDQPGDHDRQLRQSLLQPLSGPGLHVWLREA